MKHSLPGTPLTLKTGAKVWPFPAFNQNDPISVAVVETGSLSHGGTMSTISDRYYYVLEGAGTFLVDRTKIEVVTAI